jgi:hypothetical protein
VQTRPKFCLASTLVHCSGGSLASTSLAVLLPRVKSGDSSSTLSRVFNISYSVLIVMKVRGSGSAMQRNMVHRGTSKSRFSPFWRTALDDHSRHANAAFLVSSFSLTRLAGVLTKRSTYHIGPLFYAFPFLHSAVYDLIHQILTGNVCIYRLDRELFRDSARITHRIIQG